MDKIIVESKKYVTPPLTNREKDVLLLVKEGYTNQEIAKELYITEFTVKSHVSSILKKLKVQNFINLKV